MENILSALLSGVLQKKAPKVTRRVTNDKLQYAFFFKIGFIEAQMIQKGCDSYAEFGKLMGITRQQVDRLAKQKIKVTDDTMIRWAMITGLDDRWHVAFEILPCGLKKPDNHQQFNMGKYKGELPYEKYSIAAEKRKIDDKDVEKKV